MSKVVKWRITTLDPYIKDYADPVVVVTMGPSRLGMTRAECVPKWSRELLDNDGHIWSLTSREDVTVFKLLGASRIVSVMEVKEFIEMMTSYAVAKDLWTGIDYHTQINNMPR